MGKRSDNCTLPKANFGNVKMRQHTFPEEFRRRYTIPSFTVLSSCKQKRLLVNKAKYLFLY